jgi:hypothetical protein
LETGPEWGCRDAGVDPRLRPSTLVTRLVHSKQPEPTMPSRQTTPAERQIQVRQVTHVQASWTEEERGAPGAFTVQLILDHGADEYVLRPTAEDTDVLVKLLARSSNATFDVDRKVLMFGNLTIE